MGAAKERSAASLQAVCFARFILQSLRHRPREAAIAKDHTDEAAGARSWKRGVSRDPSLLISAALPPLPTPTPTPTAPRNSSSKESSEGLRKGACLHVPSAGVMG